MTAAVAPLYVIRWHYGPLPTTLLETFILATLATYVIGKWQARDFHLQRTPYDVLIGLLLLAGAIAVLVPHDHRAALGIYRAYFVEPALLYYVAVDLLRVPRHFKQVLLGLGAGGLLLAAANFNAFAHGLSHESLSDIAVTPPVAIYTASTSVAMFLEPIVAFSLAFLLFGIRRERWIAAAGLAILLVAMLLTLSRAGYLTLIALGLAAVLSLRQRRLLMTISIGAAAIVVLAATRIPVIDQRVAYLLDPTNPRNTLFVRFSIFGDALRMLRDHPIFGAGLSGYKVAVRPYLRPGDLGFLIYPHDLWLAFWSEVGLLGLIAFTLMLAALLWRGFRAIEGAPASLRAITWGAFAAFLTVLIHGFFDTPFWKNDLSLEFWLVAAIEVAVIAAAVRLGSSSRSPADAVDGTGKALEPQRTVGAG